MKRYGLLLTACLAALLAGCDVAGVETFRPAGVELELELEPADGAEIDQVRVRITASDIAEEIWAELSVGDGSAAGRVECPAGYNRLVEVDVYDAGNVAYTAAGRVDLAEEETRTVSLTAAAVDDPRLQVRGRRGGFGDRDWQYRLPTGVAAGGGGVYVVDPEAGALTGYDAEGAVLYSVDLNEVDGYAPATVTYLAAADAVLAADPVNVRLDAFAAADGGHSGSWELPGGFGEPGGLAYWSGEQRALVIDGTNSRLHLFDLDGAHLDDEALEDGAGQTLDNPVGLAVLEDDGYGIFLAVSDALAGEVYLYYYDGALEPLGRATGGDLQQPLGLTRAGGYLIVTDATSAELAVYDYLDGSATHLGDYGAPGERLGAFTLPSGAAWGDNLLWIADSGNHRLQYLELPGR
jgi:hypothetical protein